MAAKAAEVKAAEAKAPTRHSRRGAPPESRLRRTPPRPAASVVTVG